MARFRASRFRSRSVRPTNPEPSKESGVPGDDADTAGTARPTATDAPESGIPRGRPLVQDKPAPASPVGREAGRAAAPTDPGLAAESTTPAQSASGYRRESFTSRAETAGAGEFAEGDAVAPTGADEVPGGLADAVGSHLRGESTTLLDPSELGDGGSAMPAGLESTPSPARGADLRGVATEADRSDSMADLAGVSEETTDESSAENTQTEDSSTAREYLSGNSEGAGQSLDVDNMSDAEVVEATAVEADYAIGVGPGREYLKGGSDRTGQTPDVDNMSTDEVMSELDKEAEYELRGGSDAAPAYVDADSGGDSAGAAQVARDAKKLGRGFDIDDPSTPGNVDPNDSDTGATESSDTSILGMSDPGSPAAADEFGGGSIGTPPPSANIDYGEDHVETDATGGLYDDLGDIGTAPVDDTIDFDLGEEASAPELAETHVPEMTRQLGDLSEVIDDGIDDFDL
jgi:hypothetical protein